MALSNNVNLVFLHGWGTSSDVWSHQVEYFFPKYEVKTPAISLNYQLPITNYRLPILIGWSYGGMQALKIAAGSKDIKALVLVGSTAKFCDAKNGMHPAILKKIGKGLERDFEKTMRDCYITFFSREEKDAAARFMQNQPLPDKKTAVGVLEELAVLDLKDTLQKINIPTVIIHGEEDAVCPVRAGEFLHENIKGSGFKVMERTGHMPFYTRPLEFNEILEGFLRDVK